jgi:integrase
MGTHRFTDRWLKSHRAAGREEWTDTVVPGLLARFGVERVVFYARLRIEGVYVRKRIGAFPAISLVEARDAVRDMVIARERDEPIRTAGSFGELCEKYVNLWAKRQKRSWREDDRIIRAELQKTVGPRRAASIRRRVISDLLDRIVERGAPVVANRTRSLLIRIFKFGIARELVEENPAAGTERPSKEKPRQKDLSDAEIVALWRALEFKHPTTRNLLRLLLLTGCRLSELRLATWAEVQGDIFEIPGARTKNGRTHVVPLSTLAVSVIESQRGLGIGGNLIFPAPKDSSVPWDKSSMSHFARNLSGSLGFEWKPKDLRTTAVTILNRLEHSQAAPRVVNHTDSTVTARYNKYDFLAEKRAALEALGAHVQAILSAP